MKRAPLTVEEMLRVLRRRVFDLTLVAFNKGWVIAGECKIKHRGTVWVTLDLSDKTLRGCLRKALKATEGARHAR